MEKSVLSEQSDGTPAMAEEYSVSGGAAPGELSKDDQAASSGRDRRPDTGIEHEDDRSSDEETPSYQKTEHDMRIVKIEAKTEFTNFRRGLLVRVAAGQTISTEDMDQLSRLHTRAVDATGDVLEAVMSNWSDETSAWKERTKLITELEKLEVQFSATMEGAITSTSQALLGQALHQGQDWSFGTTAGGTSDDVQDRPGRGSSSGLFDSNPVHSYSGSQYPLDQPSYEWLSSGGSSGPLLPLVPSDSLLSATPGNHPSASTGTGTGSASGEHDAGTAATPPVATTVSSSTGLGSRSASRAVTTLPLLASSAVSAPLSSGTTGTAGKPSSTATTSQVGGNGDKKAVHFSQSTKQSAATPMTMSSTQSRGTTPPGSSIHDLRPTASSFTPGRMAAATAPPRMSAVHPGVTSNQPSAGHHSMNNPAAASLSAASRTTHQPAPWAHMQRIAIPVFEGEKRHFHSWWAAFSSCVDVAPVTVESKMLRLRQYLKGEPLKAIDSFGYSAAAYEAAKALLQRKYGGERRRVAIHLEEIDSMRQVRYGKAKELEQFADLLSVAVVNLKDAGRSAELGAGTFYYMLLRKLDERIVARYHRWRYDHTSAESVEGLLEFCLLEAEFLVTASETITGFGTSASSKTDQSRVIRDHRQDKPRTLVTTSQPTSTCTVCHGAHKTWRCLTFKSANPNKRWKIAKEKNLCFRCLETGHSSSACSWGQPCGISGCTKAHHRLLHGTQTPASQAQTSPTRPFNVQPHFAQKPATSDAGATGTTLSTSRAGKAVAMRTVPVVVRNGETELRVNALLDDASTNSYVSSHVANELGLTGEEETLTVKVLSGRTEIFRTTPVMVELKSVDGTSATTLQAYTADSVVGSSSAVNWQQNRQQWPHLMAVPFPKLQTRRKIDILIGLDCAELHTSLQEVQGNPGEPVARLTPLGWTCVGPVHHTAESDPVTLLTETAPQDVHDSLAQLWVIEEFNKMQPQQPVLSSEEREAVRASQQSLQLVDGHYEVGIPWRGERPNLPDNFPAAVKRLRSTERRLSQDAAAAYGKIIHDYVTKGYVREVLEEELSPGRQWFLPHFAVLRPDKETAKTRIVFDGSAKYDGVSLNDMMLPGPKLQRQLPSVLTRFRQNPVAIICDIAEMYLRVGLSPEDRPYHRFLWRDLDGAVPPRVYEFQRLVFGANASPFLAQFVSQEHAKAHASQFPLAAETMLSSTYMDDSMDSAADDDEGIMMYEQLMECWAGAGMHARKWLSNSKAVMARVPKEDRASQIDLDCPQLPSVKTLGLLWSATSDLFTFKPTAPDAKKVTKRTFLSAMASVFDPLGFVSPFIANARILLQDMWLQGVDWDDPLPEELHRRALRWYAELDELAQLEIPRCLQDVNAGKPVSRQIHVFADASESAYGAVSYLRCEYQDGHVSTTLIASRSRVAPITAVSIPRLELSAAVIGTQLAAWASDVLGLPVRDAVIWTDSLNVLHWVRNRARTFKPFVATRVGEILEHTAPDQWRHVPTKENPADVLSRGSAARNLIEDTCWWSGPAFLRAAEFEWPGQGIKEPMSTASLEQKNTSKPKKSSVALVTSVLGASENEIPWKLAPERFSSLNRLVRLRAWVTRFVQNCRTPAELRCTGQLSVDELDSSMASIIAAAQEETLEEYRLLKKDKAIPTSSKLTKLRPMLNDDGLLCVDGRLKNAQILDEESRCPVILPRGHWVTQLIVQEAHEQNHHTAGVSHTLALLSKKYWLLAG
eukprot:scpid12780/ scgid2970/ 